MWGAGWRSARALVVVVGVVGAACGDNEEGAPEPPSVVIDRAPAAVSAATRHEVAFHAVGEAAGFTCRLDGGAVEACSSPWAFEAAHGAHEVAIAAVGPGEDGAAGVEASARFAVDTVPPETVITVGPGGVVPTAVATFVFAAAPAADGARFECALDAAGFAACASPAVVTVLGGDGPHAFRVRAVDAAGNRDETPAVHAWAIDREGPALEIVARPPNPSNAAAPVFAFVSADPTAAFECQIDGVAPFAACGSPYTAPPLVDGAYTFRVRATDSAQHQTSLAYAWVVDTVPPEVAIVGGPAGPTSAAAPTFDFAHSPGAAVACAVDAGAFAPCASPAQTSTLTEGPHTFRVRATDAAGNAAEAARAFAVDTVAPVVAITSGPSGPTSGATPAWTFQVAGDPVVTECALDGAPAVPCAGSFAAPGALADGPHAFAVRVVDAAGNEGTDARAIAVDTVAPVVAITTGPTGTILDPTPTFTFAVTGAFAASRCRIDAAVYVACDGEFTAAPLGGGPHVFEVEAVDAAGNTGRATRGFELDSTAPTIAITAAPGAVTNDATPTFAFVAGGTATEVECRIDGGPFVACASPVTLAPPLAEGAHTFEVRACTPVPVCSSDVAAFEVDTTAPGLAITGGPAEGAATAASQPTFAFAATGASAVRCRIAGGAAPNPAFVPCAGSFTASGTLADGGYVFEAIAVDAAGNETARARAFSIDTAAPVISILPPVIAARTSVPRPVSFFGAVDGSGVVTACSVDGGAPEGCDGAVGYRASIDLGDGAHVYRVTATDAAGNESFAEVAFVVDTAPPSVTITGGPADPTNDNTPAFSFAVGAGAVRARCELDTGAVIDPCASGAAFPPVAPGARTFTVTVYDDAVPANTASASTGFFLGFCGDGAAQGTEACDGADLRMQTCAALGGDPAGELACTPSCALDYSDCGMCGNGAVEPGEDCDGGVGAATCVSEGYDSGALACGSACAFDTSGCGTCGDGAVNGAEVCDGAAPAGATCEGLGLPPGAVACAAGCGGVDTSGCTGGFVPAGAGFSGKVCLDGVKFGRIGGGYVAVCTEQHGVYRSLLGAELAWSSANGSLPNLRGRAIAPPLDSPSVVFLTDNTLAANGFRSSGLESPSAPMWTQVAFTAMGMPIEMFSAHPGTAMNNAMGGWHPVLGAVVLHGAFGTGATVSAVGPGVSGTVTSIAVGAFSGPSTDVNVAVYGRTPAGAPATGGIYWTCDQLGAAGGTYVARDAGIPAAEKPLVFSLTPDPFTFTGAQRLCPATGQMVAGYASTSYAALRGGGQIYKTTDGGASWVKRNAGLPAGAEVYAVALDCARFVAGFPNLCNDHELLYAATSAGLYRSTNGGASWTLAGFAGKSVRAVALSPDHPAGTAPRVVVGVDDAVGIYERSAP